MGTGVRICVLFFFGCLIINQVCNQQIKTFRCNNSRYIRNEWFCDGDKDCDKSEDESSPGCKRPGGCGRAKFSCDGQCKNITARCNTIKDCDDGTDELNCGDEINVKNCTSKGKFLCHDELRCLDLSYTCDGTCNCFDCSDENSNCSKWDDVLLKRCRSAYFITANGPQCLCEPSDNQSSPLCSSIESCGRRSSCDQGCIKFKEKMQCTCYEGYHPINGSNGAKCRSNVWYGNVVLYATMLKIKSLNVTTNNAWTVQSGIHNCTALIAANDYVYYATVVLGNKGNIFKSPLKGGNSIRLIETDFPITSIAVDYVTNNIYFTSNGSLSVCTNDGRICTQLKCCDINYVTLAPKSGWMFYLQKNSLYSRNSVLLMKSNMDGSNETVFADDVYKGNVSIMVDESETKLYLLEINDGSKVKIDRVSFDTEFKETVNSRNVRCLSVYNGDMFFTIDQKNDIFHSKLIRELRNVNEDTDAFFRDNSTSTTKFLYAYNSLMQRSNQNPCSKSSCSGICLVRPTASLSSTLTKTCVCDNFSSTNDNNRLCSNYPVQPAKRSSFGLGTFILLFIILGILGGTGYYMFTNRKWHQYYTTLQRWQRNKRDQRIIINEND